MPGDRLTCPECDSGNFGGYGHTNAAGELYYDFTCDRCGCEFRVIVEQPDMKLLSAQQAAKRPRGSFGRFRGRGFRR